MENFIAVCLALIVLELGVFIAVGVFTLLKVRQAAQAVEVTAYRVEHQVEAVGSALSNGWVGTGVKAAMAVAGHFMGRR